MAIFGIIALVLIFAFLAYFTVETYRMAKQSEDHFEAGLILGGVWALAIVMLLVGIL